MVEQQIPLKGGSAMRTDSLVWVKDNAGNRFLCPFDSLIDPNSVTDAEKEHCVDDASRLMNPRTVPGEGKMKFTTQSQSPS